MRNAMIYLLLGMHLLGGSLSADEPKVVYKSDFANAVESAIWSQTATVTSPADGEVLLGEFGTYAKNAFKLSDLPEHRYLRFKAKLHLLRSHDGNAEKGAGDTDFWTAIVQGKGSLMITSFANSNQKGGRSQAWPDEIPTANHPATTGASKINKLGFTVDELGGAVVDSTYEISMSFPHSDADLRLELGAAFSSGIEDESWAISDVVVEAFDQAAALPEAELEKLWKELSGKDPVAAHAAVWKLVEQGDAGTKFIDKQLNKRAAGSEEVFEKFVTAMDSDSFVDRQKARMKLGKQAAEFRQLIVERLKDEKLSPSVRAGLTAALEKARTDLLSSRIARLMRVSAFEPGWAQEQEKELIKAQNSAPQKDGSYHLWMRNAKISTNGFWPRFRNSWEMLEDVDAGVSLDWTVSGIKPGKYSVQLRYSCLTPGSRVTIVAGKKNIFQHIIENTTSWLKPQTFTIGEITIGAEGGDLPVNLLAAEKGAGYGFFNPVKMILEPVE